MREVAFAFSRSFVVPAALLALAAIAQPALAQCTTQWLPGDPIQGTNGIVEASTMWDPDGAGPATARVVLGGSFTIAGTVFANGVASWDPATGAWAGFGASNATLTALAVAANGDLLAGGRFVTTAGAEVGVARWNGASWSMLGGGMTAAGSFPPLAVHELLPLANGHLIAVGNFATVGGAAAANIARWNGVSWSPLGSGTNGQVHDVVEMPNGDLVAGGSFAMAGGVAARGVARWSGTSWSPLGTGIGAGAVVHTLLVLPSGDLLAGGDAFAVPGNVARWDGTSWTGLSSGIPNIVLLLTQLPNGNALACTNAGEPMQWDGAAWSVFGGSLGLILSPIRTVTPLPNGDLVLGGDVGALSGFAQTPRHVMRWDGTTVWSMPSTWNGLMTTIATMANGDLVVGGSFTRSPGGVANAIARWNGAAWSPMGGGFDTAPRALVPLPNGELIAGGAFTTANGVPVGFLARWDGVSWLPIGGGVNGFVNAAVTLANGDLVVAGAFWSAGAILANRIARWDGASWSVLGTGMNDEIFALLVLPNGDLVAGGKFTIAGGVSANRVARWDGTSWSAMSGGIGSVVRSFTWTPAGDLLATADSPNWIWRWDGTSWSSMTAGQTGSGNCVVPLPNGDLLAGGLFPFTVGGLFAPQGLARWNGVAWSPIGSVRDASVHALMPMANGDVLAGGNFTVVGDVVSASLARLTPTCPATATTFGAGCVGSGGVNTLAAQTLPWVDSTFRARGTGLPVTSIVLTLTSVTPIAQGVAPLTPVFPQAGAGCDVLTMPDLLGLVITTDGIAVSELSLPATSLLIGLPFYHQMVAIEVDAQGAWPSVTATNALMLMAGVF